MYSKLALRNIRRSLRDYIIYFITLTLTAALMYSFLALGFSPDIITMTENMSMLTSGILLLSVLIAFMSSFVIGYAIRFMLGQRKKEFATYELLGMEVRTVRNLFLAVYLFKTLYTKYAMSVTSLHSGSKKRLSFKNLTVYIVISNSGSSDRSSVCSKPISSAVCNAQLSSEFQKLT